MQEITDPTKAFIEQIEWTVTLHEDFKSAEHSFKYVLRNFGDDPGEADFYFVVPNATKVDEIKNLQVSDSVRSIPNVNYVVLEEGGVRLEFFNMLPVLPDQPKTLEFSYEGPTSSLVHEDKFSLFGAYYVHLFHEFTTKAAMVKIIFPKRSKIKSYDGHAKIEGSTIIFTTQELLLGKYYTFPIVFRRRKRMLVTFLGLGTATLGAVGDEAVSSVVQAIGNLLGF